MSYEKQLRKMISHYMDNKDDILRRRCANCKHRDAFGICPKRGMGFMPENSSTNEEGYCQQFEEREK